MLLLPLLLLFACKKKKVCDGDHDIIHYTGATISDTFILSKYNAPTIYQLTVEATSWAEDATPKDCEISNLLYIVSYAETIDTGSIKIYCNKDFTNKLGTINAGENMLQRDDVFMIVGKDQHDDHFTYARISMTTDSTTTKGTYTYYVSGTISDGSTFIDSTIIEYN